MWPFWAMHLVWKSEEGFCFPSFQFPSVALFRISNLNMYAMMQCKAKSEKLAHILGYQIWAVTARQAWRASPGLEGLVLSEIF